MQREKFKQSVFLSCGIRDIDTELLFSVTEEDLKELHPLILNQLDTYTDETILTLITGSLSCPN